MNILIVGKFESIYMYQYVKEVLMSDDFDRGKKFYFFHSGQEHIKEEYLNLYESVAEKIYYETPYRRMNYALAKAIKEVGNVDVLHVHYIKLGFYKAIKKNRKHINKLILSAWGSDLFRLPSRYKSWMNKFLGMADILATGSNNLKDWIITLNDKYDEKIIVTRFGSPVFDEIKKIKGTFSHEELRKSFGIALDSYIIACGYNGGPPQQHDKIIIALNDIEDKYKQKIFLYIPMGYGFNKDYYEKLIDLLDTTHISYFVDKKFYNQHDMARIRMMADIFIHGQTTDANSSSVFEYLYADTILINGKWLHYEDVDKYQLPIFEYNDFEELSKIVPRVIDNYDTEIENLKRKNEVLIETRSWQKLKRIWQELY